MRQKRKNRFFTFMFSFLPGAAEMYMGFMKNGLSVMGLFFLFLLPMTIFDLFEFFWVFAVVIWFFGFFHARNYASMTDEEFNLAVDKYVWDEYAEGRVIDFSSSKARTIVAVFLILIGVSQLWSYFSGMLYRLIPAGYWDDIYPVINDIPEVIFAILFVIVGIAMIRGKKRELNSSPDVEIKRIAEIEPKQESAKETKEA